jgi:hypothetical protein
MEALNLKDPPPESKSRAIKGKVMNGAWARELKGTSDAINEHEISIRLDPGLSFLRELESDDILSSYTVNKLCAEVLRGHLSMNQIRGIAAWASHCYTAGLPKVAEAFEDVYREKGFSGLKQLYFSISLDFTEWPNNFSGWSKEFKRALFS